MTPCNHLVGNTLTNKLNLSGTLLLLIFICTVYSTSSQAQSQTCWAIKDGAEAELYTWNPSSSSNQLVGPLGPGTDLVETVGLSGDCNTILSANGGVVGEVSMTSGTFNPLYTIGDLNNNQLGIQTIDDIDGMAIDNYSGYIYVVERVGGSNDLLFLIDPTTGQHVPNAFGTGNDYVPIPGALQDIDDIAFNPCSGELWGVSTVSGQSINDIIVKIDINTGQATQIATLTSCDIEGLTFTDDPTCKLYGSSGYSETCETPGMIYEIDMTNNGNLIPITTIPGGDVEALICCVEADLPSPLSCSLSFTESTCTTANFIEATGTGGSGGYTFQWSYNNQTGSQISNIPSGFYSVTVQDFRGDTHVCSINVSAKQINESEDISCSTSLVSSESCNGNDGVLSVNASGGSGNYSYNWSNGATSSSINGLSSGNYFVTITDDCGNSTECNYYLPNNCGSMQCNDHVVMIDSWSCSNACDASIPICGLDFASTSDACYDDIASFADPIGTAGCFNEITVSIWMAAADASFTKDPSAVTQVNKTYPIEINGILIGTVDPLEIAYTCNVCDFQQITLTVNPTDVNYNYGGNNTIDINFKEENSVTFVQDICIAQIELGFCSTDGPTCNINKFEDVKCFGESNGTATVSATSENGGFTYLWDNGEITATAAALNAGEHFVTVTDNFGCESVCSVDIQEPDALSCTVERVQYVECNCGDNGQAKVIPVGGNGNFTYAWSNGETTETALALGIGTHSVTITDSKNCSTTCSIDMEKDPDCCVIIRQNGFLRSYSRGN